MSSFRLSNTAKEDIIRIHQYGIKEYGIVQADKYFDSLYEHFDKITRNPYLFASVDYIKKGYRRCVCGSDSIYYRINGKNKIVEIMTIIGKQDLSNII